MLLLYSLHKKLSDIEENVGKWIRKEKKTVEEFDDAFESGEEGGEDDRVSRCDSSLN